eukprot:s6652_g2.t1
MESIQFEGKIASKICQGSVCHTDGARTYKQLGDVDSPLLDREVFDVEFSDLLLAHTAVKHKPPRPEFAKTFQVKVWTGSAWVQEERQGGTQKLDGFFASFRREVGRRPFNTAGPSLQTVANMEQHLHERVRCFQFAYWLSGSDLFQRTNTLNADPYHPPLLQGCPPAKHLQLQKCLVMGDDDEEDDTCPLCMQPMDETDISFFPCSCNYQVCLFCVHYIMEQMNGKCPACRQDYVESQFRYDASRAQSFREKRAEKKKGGSKKEEHCNVVEIGQLQYKVHRGKMAASRASIKRAVLAARLLRKTEESAADARDFAEDSKPAGAAEGFRGGSVASKIRIQKQLTSRSGSGGLSPSKSRSFEDESEAPDPGIPGPGLAGRGVGQDTGGHLRLEDLDDAAHRNKSQEAWRPSAL